MKPIRKLIFVVCLLSPASVASAQDIANGLNAEIFGDEDLKKSLVRRVDPNVDWNWGHVRPHEDVPANHFSIRWSGWIKAPIPGRYKLTLMGDDGFRLFLDQKQLMDEWKGGHITHSVSVELTGQPQEITIEYHEIDRSAWMTFWWQRLGSPNPSIVPADVLFVDEASALVKSKKNKLPEHGLIADYFDTAFKRKFQRGLVYRTEAIWGDWSAQPGTPVNGAVRYTGFLVPKQSGNYKLAAFADDHLRVWIDDKPVLEAKFREGPTSAYVDLQADTAHAITIEFTDTGAWGSYILHWIPPQKSEEEFIPCEVLYPTKQSLPKGIPFASK